MIFRKISLPGLIRGPARSRRGNVAIEFAFLVPVLMLLTLGAIELGRLGTEWTRVKHAAQAGTQFGVQDQANAANSQGMIDAARFDADDTANELLFNPLPRRYCLCPGEATEVQCSTKCADDNFSPMYVEVTISRDLPALIPYFNLPISYPISVTNTGRVR